MDTFKTSVVLPLTIAREYNTPMGHMLHCLDDHNHYVFLNDGSRFSLIKISKDWDLEDEKLMHFFCLNKVVFDEND